MLLKSTGVNRHLVADLQYRGRCSRVTAAAHGSPRSGRVVGHPSIRWRPDPSTQAISVVVRSCDESMGLWGLCWVRSLKMSALAFWFDTLRAQRQSFRSGGLQLSEPGGL